MKFMIEFMIEMLKMKYKCNIRGNETKSCFHDLHDVLQFDILNEIQLFEERAIFLPVIGGNFSSFSRRIKAPLLVLSTIV